MRQALVLDRTTMMGVVVLAAVGTTTGASASAIGAAPDDDGPPTIVVTTNILGDVVRQVVGELTEVETLMPLGAVPHDFSPSTRQAEAMVDADLLVVNGAGFEEGMVGLIERAEDDGTPIFSFAEHVELLPGSGEHADDDGEDHAQEEGGGGDPHLWTDPARMAEAVEELGLRLSELGGVDPEIVRTQTDEYVAELAALDDEIAGILDAVPDDRRVLVTNHEVFGYFADRYGFEVLGTVIPSMSTSAEASARDLDELADLIGETGVPAIFGETTGSTELAEALADEVGDVEVISLFTESLGEAGSGAETYVDMVRTNAELIAEALS